MGRLANVTMLLLGLFGSALSAPLSPARAQDETGGEVDAAELKTRIVELLTTSATQSPNEDVRRFIAGGLGEIPDPEARAIVQLTLADSSPAVRRMAVRSLAASGDSSVTPLIGPLVSDPDESVRRAAITRLVGLEDPAALSFLTGAYGSGDSETRRWILRAVGELGKERAGEDLKRGLSDGDAEVRIAAIKALLKIGYRPAVKDLAQLVESDPVQRVRLNAAFAVGRLSEDAASKARAAALLADADPANDAVAAAFVTGLQDETSLPLVKAALESTNEEVRHQAVELLEDSADPAAAIDLYAKALDDPSLRVRLMAVQGLALSGQPTAAPGLERALDDSNGRVRATGAEGLGLLKARSAVARLTTLMTSDAEPIARAAAATALGRIGDPSAFHALKTALDDSNFGVRGAAIQAAARVSDDADFFRTMARQVIARRQAGEEVGEARMAAAAVAVWFRLARAGR